MPPDVLVRFVAHPHSVRTARQLVADTLRAWGLEALVDDARLVVTELATNATLHSGSPSFRVRVTPTPGDGVRLAVGDEGGVPLAAVVRRSPRATAGAGPSRLETTTGRGLAIVEHLSVDWGVHAEDGTTWVWAQLSPTGAAGEHPAVRAPLPALATVDASGELPPGWHTVRFERCPVALGLASDEHLDELVRELQLVDRPTSEPELAAVIGGLLDGQAQARHAGRRTALDAAEQGLDEVDVELLLPSVAADQVEQLDDAVTAADALCERERLLTLASPPEVRRLRRWMREEIRDQIRQARPPRPYDDFLEATGGTRRGA